MTSLGTNGKTLEEIDETMHFNLVNTHNDHNEIHRVYKQFIEKYNAQNANYTLQTANRLFGDNSFDVLQSFQEYAKKFYYANLEQLDFKSGEAEGTINKWVEDQTNNKIKDLIQPNSLSDAVMVLVNAVYFKGTWKTPFEYSSTKEKDFHLSADNTKKVNMMECTNDFNYYEGKDLQAKIVELPYAGDHLSMIVILPDEIDGLTAVTEKLTDARISNFVGSEFGYNINVFLSLPKFKIQRSSSLKAVLAKLGINNLFSNRADFSSLSDSPVKVSEVVHKAFIEVDEKGTEAAAATGMLVGFISAMPPPPRIFTADHPFLILLIDRRTSVILFSGLVVDP